MSCGMWTIMVIMCSLCRGMPDIQWMNLDPVKLMEELSQFTSLEGFKEMLDKAQVGMEGTLKDVAFYCPYTDISSMVGLCR